MFISDTYTIYLVHEVPVIQQPLKYIASKYFKNISFYFLFCNFHLIFKLPKYIKYTVNILVSFCYFQQINFHGKVALNPCVYLP
jgi:hypothetical protein